MAMSGRSARCSSFRWRAWRGCFCRAVGRCLVSDWRWQSKGRHQVAHFLPGGNMTQGQRGASAAARLAALEVEQGEPVQEQLLVDHPFAKARGDAKADAFGKCFDHRAHV